MAKASEPKSDDARTGGVTTSTVDTEGGDIFATSGNQPVRDKVADESKGTPVSRFFTKDGTPVEPTTIPTGVTPSNLAGPNPGTRDDVIGVVEYVDPVTGATVTHDNLKAKREAEKKS